MRRAMSRAPRRVDLALDGGRGQLHELQHLRLGPAGCLVALDHRMHLVAAGVSSAMGCARHLHQGVPHQTGIGRLATVLLRFH